MISFDSFILTDGIPIYLQIIRHIKQGIVAGTVLDGDELPSRRVLSALLGVNPNTIQKAYAELERQGITYSLPGRGSFVSDNVSELSRAQLAQTADALRAAMKAAKDAGMTREEALALLSEVWEG
jgi:GntR family transcriptional regulator